MNKPCEQCLTEDICVLQEQTKNFAAEVDKLAEKINNVVVSILCKNKKVRQ